MTEKASFVEQFFYMSLGQTGKITYIVKKNDKEDEDFAKKLLSFAKKIHREEDLIIKYEDF